jgi:hypothetical protein
MAFKYCCEKDETQGDGRCSKIAMSGADYCSTHAVGHLRTMINHYSKSRVALKSQVQELKIDLAIATEALDKIIDKYFDLPVEYRMEKCFKEGKDSLIAREALKKIVR